MKVKILSCHVELPGCENMNFEKKVKFSYSLLFLRPRIIALHFTRKKFRAKQKYSLTTTFHFESEKVFRILLKFMLWTYGYYCTFC